MRISPLYCLTLPLGAAIFAYMVLRSTVITLRQGGIVWRDTSTLLRICAGAWCSGRS